MFGEDLRISKLSVINRIAINISMSLNILSASLRISSSLLEVTKDTSFHTIEAQISEVV